MLSRFLDFLTFLYVGLEKHSTCVWMSLGGSGLALVCSRDSGRNLIFRVDLDRGPLGEYKRKKCPLRMATALFACNALNITYIAATRSLEL